MPTSIITHTASKCTPFLLRVMVFSPEAGFRFDVTVQRICPADGSTVWKIVFHLFKKQATGSGFDLIVSVEFEGEASADNKAIETMSNQGVTVPQHRAFRKKVFPATKPLADGHTPTPAENQKVHTEMKGAIHAT